MCVSFLGVDHVDAAQPITQIIIFSSSNGPLGSVCDPAQRTISSNYLEENTKFLVKFFQMVQSWQKGQAWTGQLYEVIVMTW